MAEEKKTRTRRSRTDVLQSKLDKAIADKEKCTQKIATLDEEIKNLQEELNAQRVDEVMEAVSNSGLSIDQVLNLIQNASVNEDSTNEE